jgi:PEP-CTERM motif
LSYTIIGEEPAGTYTDQLMLPSNIQSGYLTAIGIATASPPSEVVIGLNNSVSYLGDPWSSLFSETESQVLNDLVVLDSSDLINFMGNNYSDYLPFSLGGGTVTGAVAEFSNGANVGTFSVGLASVPEPATGFLVLAGALIGIAKIRCRRIFVTRSAPTCR